MPRAIKPIRRQATRTHTANSGNEPHHVLLARWLIQITLCLGWYHREHPGRFPAILEDNDFLRITGYEVPWRLDEDGDLVIDRKYMTKMTDSKLASQLKARLEVLEKESLPENLPLIRNVDLLGNRLGLNEADKAVIRFAVALKAFGTFRNAIRDRNETVSQQQLARVIAVTSGLQESAIADALKGEAPLRATGIISLAPDRCDLEDKLDLMDRLASILVMPDMDGEAIIANFLRPASLGTLDLDAFPHLALDLDTVLPYLRNVLSRGDAGVNILFYGPPGTGKTELAKAIASQIGAQLFEISYADEDGDPIRGNGRLRAYNMCQRLMANMPNALLMFDEIEDVFPSNLSAMLISLFGGAEGSGDGNSKAWINRTLERNPMPSIWITNNARIDPAYLRRFDYSIRFPIPPQSVRMTIASHHFGEFSPTEQDRRKRTYFSCPVRTCGTRG